MIEGAARRDEGAVGVFTVILVSVVFLGFSALVVDLGMARDTRRQAQNAADASALAAGNAMYLYGPPAHILTATMVGATPGAVDVAKAYAQSNYGGPALDWTTCRDAGHLSFMPDLPNECISFSSKDPADASTPDQARVRIPDRQVATPFAQIWGRSTVAVSAVAQIELTPKGLAQCGLCVIGTGPHNLKVGLVKVTGAEVAFNGNLSFNNNGTVANPNGITVSTGYNIDLTNATTPNGVYPPAQPLLSQTPIVDPLVDLAMPSMTGPAQVASGTCNPGVYKDITNCTALNPGLYVLTTGDSGGNNSIVADGVTLYLTCATTSNPPLARACNSGEAGAGLNFNGNGTLNLTPPATGLTKGLSIISDRNNTSTIGYTGNGAQSSSGTVYAAAGTLDYRGNGALVADSLIVVSDIVLKGTNPIFNIAPTQSSNQFVPPEDLHLTR